MITKQNDKTVNLEYTLIIVKSNEDNRNHIKEFTIVIKLSPNHIVTFISTLYTR